MRQTGKVIAVWLLATAAGAASAEEGRGADPAAAVITSTDTSRLAQIGGGPSGPERQAVHGSSVASLSDEAWWTGSLLSASAATMPVGHLLVEPSVVAETVDGYYDRSGSHRRTPRVEDTETAAYVMYGLADGLSVGTLPRVSLAHTSATQGSSGVTVADVTLLSQLRLTRLQEGGWIPATSLVLGETFPTGRYDRLESGPNAGTGSGVHTTEISFYAQSLLRAYRDRPMRVRLNVTYGCSDTASLSDVSVYGTARGFHGRVRPGAAITADSAFEYSITRHWVLALDAVYQHEANTTVAGYVTLPDGTGATKAFRSDSGPSASWSLAPAVEYNFNSNIGVITGVTLTAWGRNAASTSVAAMALNMYF